MEPLDYKLTVLKADGDIVDEFCIAGLLVEDGLVLSLEHRVDRLCEAHMPLTVNMTLDGYIGVQMVKTYEAERRLAVLMARRIRVDLHAHGLVLRDARVPATDSLGNRVSDHDMQCEIVTGRDGVTALANQIPKGFLSGEVRCRRLREEAGFKTFRAASQKECDLELEWWQEVLRADADGDWCGRLILLCNFYPQTGRIETRADVRLVGGQYKGLWGWPGSGEIAVAAAKAASKPAAKPVAKAVAKPHAKPKIAPVPGAARGERLLQRLVWINNVVELKALMQIAGKADSNSRYWADKAKEAGYGSNSVYQKEQRDATSSRRGVKRKNCGGSGPWMGNRAVCVYLLKRWNKYY